MVSATATNTVLIFGVCKPRSEKSLPPFISNKETAERVIVREPRLLAFDEHTKILKELLERMAAAKKT